MMSTSELDSNAIYLLSIKPFFSMLNNEEITQEDFDKIERFLLEKYKPIFVSKYVFHSLDNKKNER